MQNRHAVQKKNPTVLILGQLIIVALCLSYTVYILKTVILPDKDAHLYFRQTECLIMSKRLNTQGLILDRHRAEFLLSYNVNGTQYSRWVSGNGLDEAFTQSKSIQESYLNEFEVGRSYACYYDPENPQVSLLIFRNDWFSIFPLLIPGIIGVFALYYLSKTLILFFRYGSL